MAKEQDILSKIGKYLGKKAQSKFKSNVELADVANVDEKTIRRLFEGKQNVSVKLLKSICDALGISLQKLFEDIKE